MDRLRAHRAADAFIQGTYQRHDPTLALGYRGCALGCTLPKQLQHTIDRWTYAPSESDRSCAAQVQQAYGIDWRVAYMIDYFFEECDSADAGDFAFAVIDAIPVGADLSEVAENAQWDYDNPGELVADLAAAPVPVGAGV